VQLRHLVLAVGGDDPLTGFIIKPGGARWDITISGYILNGIYV
jgi:hypothetical protein